MLKFIEQSLLKRRAHAEVHRAHVEVYGTDSFRKAFQCFDILALVLKSLPPRDIGFFLAVVSRTWLEAHEVQLCGLWRWHAMQKGVSVASDCDITCVKLAIHEE